MAKFYPPESNNDYQGENDIFNLFQDYVNNSANDTSSWLIFHSLNLSSSVHFINREGEIDFYIIIPDILFFKDRTKKVFVHSRIYINWYT